MPSPLLNWFIFICKIIICISIFVSLNTHHWMGDVDRRNHRGPQLVCYDYGHFCYKMKEIKRGILFFYIIALLNVILELLNIIFLCKRTRTRINLILEELGVLTTIVFLILGTLVSLAVCIFVRTDMGERLDWSFKIFVLSLILALIDLICSLVRVVSYCRDNSFRSSVVTYTSNHHDETVRIQ